MHRISKLKRLRESEWLADLVNVEPSDVKPPEDDECNEWGIQNIGIGAKNNVEIVASGLRSLVGEFWKNNTDKSESDGKLAARLHGLLDGVDPREAADAGLWAYLAAFACPGYVRWRWDKSMQLRMAGSIRRNALARLWWWAEVTHDSSYDVTDHRRYAITKQTKGRADLVLWMGDCAFAGNRAIARRLCELQTEKKLGSSAQQDLCRTMNRILKMQCLDALPDASIRDACDRALQISSKD
jgi:hypothetical protein